MAGTSTKTKVISVRLPNDVVETIQRRAISSGQYKDISKYLRDRIVYDTRRKHGTRKRK